jgi:Fic family protein
MGFGQYQIAPGISSLLESLDREVKILHEKRPLNRPVLQRMEDWFRSQHVYHSNAIEGNSLTLAETELVIREGLTVSGKPMKDHLEAVNLNFAINYVEELARKKGPVTERAIKEMHQMILRQIDDANAGQYRKVSVMIGGSDFRPPEPIKVQERMDEFMRWYATPASEHPVVKAAKTHTWLVEIHPFVDGNGRASRLLMNLHLLMNDYPIAIIRQEERPRYYNALELSHQGDLTPFVELVIERINHTAREYLRAIHEDERAREWAKSKG